MRRDPLLQRRPGPGLDEACRDVETTISRVAKVVLHASALADRMDATAAATGHRSPRQAGHVRVLRDAADAGRRVALQVGLAAGSTTTPVR